jgi:phosphotransferase system enzyme I (PtsI)
MIEIPAAALTVRSFLQYFDFLSIGTNDLIQYTLAIDRADEDRGPSLRPMHPAVLRLVAEVIAAAMPQAGEVCVCGEMAGDLSMTRLLLGLGLRSFSMHPAQILAVKQEVLRADCSKLAPWASEVLAANARRRCWRPEEPRKRPQGRQKRDG